MPTLFTKSATFVPFRQISPQQHPDLTLRQLTPFRVHFRTYLPGNKVTSSNADSQVPEFPVYSPGLRRNHKAQRRNIPLST